ncbi:MAG: AAA family ATPase [Sphaerochaetaceae bacterium]|nr:AAA family ATPase [Sphaerochaetaceae bacterium]
MNKQLAEMDPSLVLEGDYPRLIDEWQVVPSIWDAVRFQVDQSGKKGMYILTGSSTPAQKGRLHGGSGRIGKIRMRTMSLYESGYSSGDVSLMDFFDDSLSMKGFREIHLSELVNYVVRGGWPGSQGLSVREAMRISQDYLANIPDDMERVDGKKRDIKKTAALLRALGRAESNMTSKKIFRRILRNMQKIGRMTVLHL